MKQREKQSFAQYCHIRNQHVFVYIYFLKNYCLMMYTRLGRWIKKIKFKRIEKQTNYGLVREHKRLFIDCIANAQRSISIVWLCCAFFFISYMCIWINIYAVYKLIKQGIEHQRCSSCYQVIRAKTKMHRIFCMPMQCTYTFKIQVNWNQQLNIYKIN